MSKALRKGLIVFIICIPSLLPGQTVRTISLRAGYGYYQGFFLATNYSYTENLNIGIGVGSHFGLPPLENEDHYNVTIENNLHFGKRNKYNAKPWIFGQQVMYWIHGYGSVKWKILSISPTIGRAFAISSNLGIAFEIGPTFNLVLDVDREPTDEIEGWMWPISYNGRVQLIYKL